MYMEKEKVIEKRGKGMIIIRSKRQIVSGLLVLVLGLSTGIALRYSSHLKTFGKGEVMRILVDPGHGLPDGGAVGIGGTVEQEINLAIAKKLQEVLTGKGITVVMTRSTEEGLHTEEDGIRQMKRNDMQTRLRMMKDSGADLFLSIHMNYFTSSEVNGLRVFYAKNHPEVKLLAEEIQLRMGGVTGAKMVAVKAADANLFLMKAPPIPAILVECGFLSNPEEEKKLNDEDYQARLAWAIADAVEKYYKNKKDFLPDASFR